ncbi:hypothetical protein CBR_g51802 [Chara braunii]|uniref:beta-aspartyl-peptidase n=1 Tax=Chara braunii TaxID=69332 RepID=A0A388M914_CHABU|nr:hypothetical protein CBR_g51802 [Chara braunii]|eukprot:GBG91068.1 hypothetical protein CBR_g51802 [Chara braunii]
MNMIFQNFVNKTRLTQGMINFCVIVYMDDILVYLETYHGHAQHIEWTLGALRDAGFKIALEKSEFFLSEISFLGYVVTRGGLRPDSRKVAAVKEALVPTSLMQVRAFLGLASYYRRFIKGFAAIAQPLTDLLRKDHPLSWDAECEQAFATLKDALATTPILIRPDPSKQFILITDWQPEAIFAILAQKQNDGREHVIEYASRTVPDERRNDSAPQGSRGRGTGITANGPSTSSCLSSRRGKRKGRAICSDSSLDRCGPIVEIVSQSDESPVPHVLTRTLVPYLQWSACLEEPGSGRNPPSQRGYLDSHEIIDLAFFQDRTASENEEVEIEAEEESSEEEEEAEEEANEEETFEEGSYSEHNEGEQSEEDEVEEQDDEEEEERDQEELEESEWEGFEEEVRDEARAQAQAQKREEIAVGKRQLEFASAADQPLANDPARDPEPPKPEDGETAAETSAAPARRRRNNGANGVSTRTAYDESVPSRSIRGADMPLGDNYDSQGMVAIQLPLVINTWNFPTATLKAWDIVSGPTKGGDGSLITTNYGSNLAVDAVVAGCSACEEERCDRTVGYGGSPDESGETTLDAMVMEGATMDVGAVGSLRGVKHAACVARLVLRYTEHTLLVGEQAAQFALSMGLAGPTNLSTAESVGMWTSWIKDNCQPNFRRNVVPDSKTSCGPYRPSCTCNYPIPTQGSVCKEDCKEEGKATVGKAGAEVGAKAGQVRFCGSREDPGTGLRFPDGHRGHDTIAMAVIDKHGNIAVGTSTNGASHKIPGRVGDGPIPGAAAYADNDVGACGATGDGDIMMRFLPCYQVVESMRRGMEPKAAAEDAIARIRRKYPKFVGAIFAVDRKGRHAGACHGWTFTYLVRSAAKDDVQLFTVSPAVAVSQV